MDFGPQSEILHSLWVCIAITFGGCQIVFDGIFKYFTERYTIYATHQPVQLYQLNLRILERQFSILRSACTTGAVFFLCDCHCLSLASMHGNTWHSYQRDDSLKGCPGEYIHCM